MNAMRRCHFRLRNVGEFDKLRIRLSEHIECLLKICPDSAPVHLSLLEPVAGSDQSTDLRFISEVYAEEAEERRGHGRFYKSFGLGKSVAEFKVTLEELPDLKAPVRIWDMQEIQYDPKWTFGKDKSIVAIESRSQSVCYIVSAYVTF